MFTIDVSNLNNGNIKGSTTEIVDRHLAIAFLLFQAVCQSGRCGFVDNPLDVQPGNLSSIFGRLTLRIIKISRHSDHGLVHLMTQIIFGGLLHLL